MIKRKSILLSLLVPFLLNLVFCVNFITAAQNDISKGVDIDRSNIPKNILFGSFMGGRSHVKPMLDIAEILAERSYNVILLASGNNVLSSEYPAVKQISLGPSTGMKNLGKDGIDEEQDYNAMKSLWEIGVISYKRTYEKYKSVVEDYNIDLIFCDLLINEACVDVANTLKKPVVVLVSALQIVDPKPYKFDPILGCNISLENESIWERFRCNFIQVFRYVYSLSDFTNQLNEMRKQMNVDLGQLTLGGFKASLVLIDTFFGFELPQTLPPYIQEIGPILSEEYPPLTPELSDFIMARTRFISINKKIIDGVVWALVETPKDYFYPTLKLSDGTQIQASQILNNEHPHIHIAEFVPQFAILNHTNTKLFFNHGGAGRAHESLYTGTPMLVLPLLVIRWVTLKN
ncbi:5630_t:CDS:2 [Rhizophagus irregularis]|nr:5630_t:CDS:2 [Rhizophagus irregularis]